MKNVIVSLLIAVMLGGCVIAMPGHLYPVQGPLAARTPVPIYKVSLTIIGPQGQIYATLRDGEVCYGKLEQVASDDPTSRNTAADWDSVYGSGFFEAKLLGKEHARANLIGNKGTHLHVELFNPRLWRKNSNPRDIVGIARDDHGNLYKVTF